MEPSKWRCSGSLPWYLIWRAEMRLTASQFSNEETEALRCEDPCPSGSALGLASRREGPCSPLPLCLPLSLFPLGQAPRVGRHSKVSIKTQCSFMVGLFALKDIKSKLITFSPADLSGKVHHYLCSSGPTKIARSPVEPATG